ncbi:MAG: hypothetical protein IIX01_02525 [Clostridia bacterium]|nr:hypothetical protein [Clostridia bacterium]
MGKKKSVVLLTLITIVIVVFCAISAIPSFPLSVFDKDSIKVWTPATNQYDLDSELGGGYYTYYIPNDVITEAEYEAIKEEKAGDVEELEKLEKDYVKHKGLYLPTDEELGVVKYNGEKLSYEVTESFKASFSETAEMIAQRYAARGLSYYRVSVVDDYALKVELPISDSVAGTVFSYFGYTGEFTVSDGTTQVFPVKGDDDAKAYFKSFKVKESGKSVYIEIKTTGKGSEKLSTWTTASSDSQSATSVNFQVGGTDVLPVSASYLQKQSKNVWVIGMNDKAAAEAIVIVLNSAIAWGDTGIEFKAMDNSIVGGYKAVYGDNAKTLMFIAVGVALLLAIVLPIIGFKGFGVALAYSTLTYFGVTAFCFAFITESVFEVSAGTAIVFLLGLLANVFVGMKTYEAIKKEFYLGKTIDSAVKTGYKKSLMFAVDVCVVFALSALALLIGAGGLHTFAIQALICAATFAFCSLLWTRVINYLLVSASKDKVKHFRFVREDNDDE